MVGDIKEVGREECLRGMEGVGLGMFVAKEGKQVWMEMLGCVRERVGDWVFR